MGVCIVLESNTVSPMYAKTTNVSLPGAPMSEAESNARAKLATIIGLEEIVRTCSSALDTDMPWGVEARELIEDNDWSDYGHQELRDAAEEYAMRDLPLGIDYTARWSAGTDFDGKPDRFQIWLSFGGPTCWIEGGFDRWGEAMWCDIELHGSWASTPERYSLGDDECHALAWFSSLVTA